MRSDIHPGWEALIYLLLIAVGVAFVWAGSSEPETVCALTAHT